VIPEVASGADFQRWLPSVKGKIVLLSMAQPTCRPDENWREFADSVSFARLRAARTDMQRAWNMRLVRATGGSEPANANALAQAGAAAQRTLTSQVERAGAIGVVTHLWSNGWGVDKIFNARTASIPTFDLSCEDYGLVYRLAERNQGPRLRVQAESQDLGEVPVHNVVATMRGREKPDEYVLLSAHYDSWDGASGATDNGTGTLVMMEAMRILKQVYPNPKRTIMVGHWGGEEQGLIGSGAFAADHPEVVKGLQAQFNQDNGTGRVISLSTSGLVDAGANYARWLARLPQDITRHFTNIGFPGSPAGGGSDNASFACYGAPGFSLGALNWSYGTYTWHTNRDTFDKIVWDDVRNNAILTAMLAYLASEDPTTVPRERRVLPPGQNGQPGQWPACRNPQRSSEQYMRVEP
jgi:carboxypeptidase Q